MGGDHKCPLCSATFTRPQHVGRHLRAHTGDRPYECKECPLRFARSDLLSRHVTKAHRPPIDGEGPKKDVKKGRRKSLPSSSFGSPNGAESQPSETRRSSCGQVQQPQPPLQAQSMYPHHPLLADSPLHPDWPVDDAVELSGVPPPNFSNPFSNEGLTLSDRAPNPMYPPGFVQPFAASPMRMTNSEQGSKSTSMARDPSYNALSSMGFEYGFKKRACDQCNHSKVRCDSTDPCVRCASRNLVCTYLKPQKPRKATATAPNQSVSQPQLQPGSYSSTSHSTSSDSPLSHFSSSSPSIDSPVTARLSPNIQFLRPSSLAGVPKPSRMDRSQLTPFHAPNPLPWETSFQPMGASRSAVAPTYWPQPTLGSVPVPSVFDPACTIPAMSSSQPGPLSHVYPSLGAFPPHPNALRFSTSSTSPPVVLAPTPSLTSHSTSPSSSEEVIDRRMSQASQFSMSSHSGGWQETLPGKQNDSMANFAVLDIPTNYSPTDMSGVINLNSINPSDSSMMGNFSWLAPGHIVDPHHPQDRQTLISDDEASGASTHVDLDENAMRAMHERRRSSAGVWAKAFHEMTLQDGTHGSLPLDLLHPSDPFDHANHAAHHLQYRRPTFPMFSTAEGGPSSKLPSLSDVKDLWKLFMDEPTSGPTTTAMSEKQVDHDAYLPPMTPRPGLGGRTLSRSNSMPDLQSPSLTGQTFFSTYANGATPVPAAPQQSYLPPHQLVAPIPRADDVAVRKWKHEIQQRQTAFNIIPGGKMGMSSEADNLMHPPTSHRGRPTMSVLQGSSSLEQTLAPERTPSFGMPEQANPSAYQYNLAKTPSKLTSAMARPGNKRLASQTLVPDTQKRAGLGGWEGADDGTLPELEEERPFQGPAGSRTVSGETFFNVAPGMATVPTASPEGMYPMASDGNVHPMSRPAQMTNGNGVYFSTWPPVGPGTEMRMAGM